MTRHVGPLYEMNFVFADGIRSEVEVWLEVVVEAARRRDGVDDVHLYEFSGGVEGFSAQSCLFQARDDSALDELLDGYFSAIDAEAATKFHDSLTIDSRTLRSDETDDLPLDENPKCLNCGTRLRGQYCGRCGQRSRGRLISIWQLLREAFGDLFELDSRLWRTLGPLMIRPGRLTRDYLEGRRARYMPPFRTYLVLSVIFFVIAFFNPRDDLSLFFEPEPPPTAEEVAALEEAAKIAAAAKNEREEAVLREVEGLVDDLDDDDININFGSDEGSTGMFGDCKNASISDEGDLPEWFKKRFTDERVKQICERNEARGVENLGQAVVDNIPVALIVLLPLMALVLKLLYPLSRRFFVEHLLFFVHFHAFFFLMLTVQILFARLAGLVGPEDGAVDNIKTLILIVAGFYIPVYLYKAMRHVYGQGHLITILKYLLLLIAYISGAAFTMIGVLLVALLSA